MSDGHVGGWLVDAEDREQLAASSFDGWHGQVEGLFSAPEEIDPRPWHKVENQGQQGACQGHALTSCAEMCFNIATGQVQQFSRQAAYIWTQNKDGIRGDRGSTITGGEWVAKNVGFCLESLWPYQARYVIRPPSSSMEACKADAAKRRIRTTSAMKSYDDCFKWLSAGLGGVELGIIWNASMHGKGVIESYNPSGRGGGHAVAFLGYSARKDAKGRKFLWLANSWGSWGNKGYAEVAPAAVDAMFASKYTVMRGLSDLSGADIKPRPVDFSKEIRL